VTTVGIFFGGRSHEHIVSVETANALIPLLRVSSHDIAWVYVSEQGRLLGALSNTRVAGQAAIAKHVAGGCV